MEYTVEIEVDLPRARVIELFDSTENLYKWMEGLQSFEHVSGEQGKEGQVSRLKFKYGKREMEMLETVTKKNLPDEFFGTYDSDMMFNWIEIYFKEMGPDKTKMISKNKFKSSKFMLKLMMGLMPGMFKKQSVKHLTSFKNFAEGEGKG